MEETRKAGAQTVVCVMSGNFVQRGEIAFCDKRLRAEIAVRSGADLVLELPLPYVLSGAGAFAEGAAKVSSACGVSGTVSFGAAYSAEEIRRCRRILDKPEIRSSALRIVKEKRCAYPSAVCESIRNAAGEDTSKILLDPNSVLALEYMDHFDRSDVKFDYFSVLRPYGSLHDGETPVSVFASAKYLRDLFYESGCFTEEFRRYVPPAVLSLLQSATEAGSMPPSKQYYSVAAMSRLFLLSKEELAGVNGVSQGLENRIFEAVKQCSDLYELFDLVKMKRFTHARIRQSVVSAALGIRRTDLTDPLPYVRVLGMNEKGRAFLHNVKKSSEIPFIMNISEAPECRMRELDCGAAKFYELCRPNPGNVNAEYLVRPFVL